MTTESRPQHTIWGPHATAKRLHRLQLLSNTSHSEKTKIFYDPQQITPQEIVASIHTLEAANRLDRTEHNRANRGKAKFRGLLSPATLLCNGIKEIDPIAIRVLTICMIYSKVSQRARLSSTRALIDAF